MKKFVNHVVFTETGKTLVKRATRTETLMFDHYLSNVYTATTMRRQESAALKLIIHAFISAEIVLRTISY